MPALADPDNLTSEPSASELKKPSGADKASRLPRRKAEALVELVKADYQESKQAREDLDPDIALAIAYEQGNQWMEYSKERGLFDSRTASDKKWYRKANIMRPLGRIAVARITSNRPDVTVRARSNRDLDKQAKKEAELGVAHYNTKNNIRRLINRAAYYAWCATTAFLYQGWDPYAEAEVAVEFDPETNEPTRYEKRPVGDYIEYIVPGHEVFADPRARSWEECRWIVHVQVMGLADIKERWGKSVDESSAIRTTFRSIMDSFVSPWTHTTTPKKSAEVMTRYEMPTPGMYPKGRVITVCNDEVLEYREELEFGHFPLVPVGYQEIEGTCYHRGAGPDLYPLQYDYNILRSRWLGSLRDMKLTIVRQRGDGAGADATDKLKQENQEGVDETPRYRTIWYRAGRQAPQFELPPPMPASDFTLAMREIRQEMEQIGGVHRSSSGAGDPNAKSGLAIRLLQDADESSSAEFGHNFEYFLEERARRMIEILVAYVKEKRAWELNETGNSEDAELVYSGLEALRNGGMAAVNVIEGSGTSRTPEAQDQEILDLAREGFLGDMADPDIREMVLGLLNTSAASRAMEAIFAQRDAKAQEAVIKGQIEDELDAQGGMGGLPVDPSQAPPAPPLAPEMALPMEGAPPLFPQAPF